MPQGSSWPSVEMLQERCAGWFAGEFGSTPWFPGRWCSRTWSENDSGITDVVLFGDFAEQLLSARSWPESKYRIWVLSRASARVVSQVFGLPANCIGVVPRYELFPKSRRLRPPPRRKQPWTLVYAGRISLSKNFDFVLRVTSVLQTVQKLPVELAVIGDVDEIGIEELGVPGDGYDTYVANLVRSLPWTKAPEFLGSLPRDRWPSLAFARPVFVSFSRYFCEDFGVSVAQAQERGWPCVISDWGGHSDVVGSNVLKISARAIGTALVAEPELQARARAVAQDISNWLIRQRKTKAGGNHATVSLPRPVSRSWLMTRVKSLKCSNKDLAKLTKKGKNFFQKYHEAFSG